MGRTCAVTTCSNIQENEAISLFKFKYNEKWLSFLRIAYGDYPLEEVKGMYICSEHFREDLVNGSGQRRRIVKEGYPTLLTKENLIEQEQELTLEESCRGEVVCDAAICKCGAAETVKIHELTIKKLTQELDDSLKANQELTQKLSTLQQTLERKRNTVRIFKQKEKRQEKKRKRDNEDKKNAKKIKTAPTVSSVAESDPQLALLTELMERTGAGSTTPFSYMLKEFSFELHYYSPRAYNFVRYRLPCLPHPRRFNDWTCHVKTKPGFLPNCLEFLKSQNAESDNQILWAMSCDEVYTRKQILHDGEGFIGLTDYGDIVKNPEPDKEAKTALFIMATAINANCRVPIGYVLTHGLTADTFAKIIEKCLEVMHESKSRVISITFDGLGVNTKAVTKLGANLNVESNDFKPFIPHPTTKEKVHIILDPSHMLKLLRNLWNHFKILFDKDGKKIEWQYITELQKLQERCGLKAANKLTKRHVKFHQQKMKTNLCVQTLSNSVSVALGVCQELGMPGFRDTKPTEDFLSLTDRIFDSLNSKSTGIGYKAPINSSNLQTHRNLFENAKEYFSTLQVMVNGNLKPLLQTGRKTAIVGLIVTLSSVQNITDDIIANKEEHLQFLSTYKLSQVMIEMFFSTLRSRFGYNNNPNVKQLQQALKGMLCMNMKCINTGNCLEQEEMLTKVSPLKTLHAISEDNFTRDEEEELTSEEDEVKLFVPTKEESSFIDNIIAYIAGYVVRKICSHSSCSKCICKVMASANDVERIANDCVLILKRDKGGLIYPSHAVISVCKLTELAVREAKRKHSSYEEKNLLDVVRDKSQQQDWLAQLNCQGEIAHTDGLVREIASIYLTTRMHHLAKESTFELCPVTVRSTCVNVTQFKGN